VTELITILEQSQPRISRHLKLMVESRFARPFSLKDPNVFLSPGFGRLECNNSRVNIVHFYPTIRSYKRDHTKLQPFNANVHYWAADYF